MGTFEKNGSLIVGDVHPNVAEVAGALTPVPGGVGPLTIAMLLVNTITAAEAAASVLTTSSTCRSVSVERSVGPNHVIGAIDLFLDGHLRGDPAPRVFF